MVRPLGRRGALHQPGVQGSPQVRGVRVRRVLQPFQAGQPQPPPPLGRNVPLPRQPRVDIDPLPNQQVRGNLPPRRLRPTRGRGYQANRQPRPEPVLRQPTFSSEEEEEEEEEEDPKIVALQSLCERLQQKLETAEESFERKIQAARREATEKVEEENSILQYKLNKNINSHLSVLEDGKSKDNFKHKASGCAIQRIVDVRKKLRDALTEADRDFDDFSETNTGKILGETLELLDQQEGLIRVAESSKFGYRILDKIKEDHKTPSSLIKNQELLDKLSLAEKELEKEDEASTKRTARRRRRSRTRSRSRSPLQKKGTPGNNRPQFSCHFCHIPGHS